MPNQQAVDLANTFVERYAETGAIAHMKLQKLCYYAYGWWLALRPNDPKLTTVGPQVWKLGPVFHPIFSAYASNSGDFLRPDQIKPATPFGPARTIPRDDSPDSQIVDWIWGRYGGYTGQELSNMTHEPGTPWYTVAQRHHFAIPKFTELPDDEIRTYFHNMAVHEGFIGTGPEQVAAG